VFIRDVLQIGYHTVLWVNVTDDRKDETLWGDEIIPVPKRAQCEFESPASSLAFTDGDMTDEVY